MRPNGQSSSDDDMFTNSSCVSQTDKYRCIDDPVDSPDDTDYVSASQDAAYERYNLTDYTLPAGATITSIRTTIRYRGGSTYGTRCTFRTWLRIGSASTSYQGLDDTLKNSTWSNMTRSWTTEPDGTTWDASDLPNLVVGLNLDFTRVGPGRCYVSQLYVTVRYNTNRSNPVKTISFNLEAPPVFPAGATITHVTTRFRYNDNSDVGTCEISTKLRLNSTNLLDVSGVNANPTAWENVTGNATAKPGGGPWAVTDFANLQVGLSMRTLGGDSSRRCLVTQLYIAVHYSGASTPVNTISFGLSNPTTIPNGATIAKIETHFRYADASLPNGTCEISASLRINGRQPSNPVASVNNNPSGWTSASGASRAKPTGSAWTQADLNSLQVVLAMRVLGGNASSQCQVTQLYAVVDFRENTTDTAIHEISFAIGNPTIPVNATIQTVVTHFRYDHSGSGSGSCRIWSTLRLRSSTLSSVSSVSARPARWTDVEGTATTKPGGGVWLRTDIPALEVGLRMKTVGAGTCKVTQVYAVVHYRVSVTDTAVHAINFGVSVPAMPVNASIQKVATHFRYTSAGATSGVCNINSTLHLRGSTLSAVSSVSARPTTWTDVGGESTERPGGGEWTTADLGDLELGLRMRAIGIGLICRVTQMNATIHYTITTVTGATKEVVSYAPLSLGATYDLAFISYRGELKLRVDGVEEVVAKTAPDAIPVSGEDLVVGGGWKGAIGRTRVSEVGVIPYQYADGTGNGQSADVGFFTEPLAATHRGALAPFDQYLSFPGRANALDVSNFNGGSTPIDNIFAGGGTVEFCAQPPSDPTSTSIIRPISKTAWAVLFHPAADAMNFVFMHGYATEKGEWAFPTQDGEWHCYAAAFDRDQAPDTVALYIDGQPVTATIRSTRSGAPSDDSGDRFSFGTTTSVEYAGGLDEIRLWDDIRTADEVAANWNTPVADPPNAGGLVGYWPLDDRADNEIRLDLQYQAPHTTETQKGTEDNAWNWLGVVDDQSSFGNDADYSFLRDTSTSAVTKGGLAIRNPTQPVGLGIPNPGRVVQPLVDGDIGTGGSAAASVPIIGLLVSVFADVADIDYTLIWVVLILGMAVVVLIGMVKVTGEPVSAMFAAGLVLAFGAMIDVLSWIVLILYVILGVGLAAILLRRP